MGERTLKLELPVKRIVVELVIPETMDMKTAMENVMAMFPGAKIEAVKLPVVAAGFTAEPEEGEGTGEEIGRIVAQEDLSQVGDRRLADYILKTAPYAQKRLGGVDRAELRKWRRLDAKSISFFEREIIDRYLAGEA